MIKFLVYEINKQMRTLRKILGMRMIVLHCNKIHRICNKINKIGHIIGIDGINYRTGTIKGISNNIVLDVNDNK